jgi:DNA-binding transcriptional regulator LsrR (DeoR family)
MRKLREILRLKYVRRMGHRAIARSCGVGVGTVSEYVSRARRAGLSWPLPPDLDDGTLEARLFAAPESKRERIPPDVARIHRSSGRA